MVRDFVRREVEPAAAEHDAEDTVPYALIDRMKELGLFGINVPEEYGGMGLDYTTFAMIFEEISKGYMALTGTIGTHHILTYVLTHYGTEAQRERFLPRLASGAMRGGLALTEPGGGSDVGALQTRAVERRGGVCGERFQDVHHQRRVGGRFLSAGAHQSRCGAQAPGAVGLCDRKGRSRL